MMEDINSHMEFQDSKSEYKVLKLVDGNDILCKLLSEYDDAIVVECPLQVTKQIVSEKREHTIEHTGLQRWMSFTNDINFVIEKHKILGSADLSPEVTLYYKMIARKSKEESVEEQSDDIKTEEELLDRLRNNVERLTAIMEGGEDTDFDEDFDEDVYENKKILH